MKNKKEFNYHLKKDVRDDLEFLSAKLCYLLRLDDEGFDFTPSFVLPALFKVYTHLIWCTKFESWFKKVYKL